jgi:hypothetical protein
MTYTRTLQLLQELVQNNRQVQTLLDKILDTAVNPQVLENREDWPEVKKTVELFAYTGIVLEPHRRRRAEEAWKAPKSTPASAE